MRTYLNNPVGVHDAAMAEPVQRTVGGRLRYVSCLRFIPRESDGSYRELRERAILYVNGRLDRIVENASEICAGAALCAVSGPGKANALAPAPVPVSDIEQLRMDAVNRCAATYATSRMSTSCAPQSRRYCSVDIITTRRDSHRAA